MARSSDACIVIFLLPGVLFFHEGRTLEISSGTMVSGRCGGWSEFVICCYRRC